MFRSRWSPLALAPVLGLACTGDLMAPGGENAPDPTDTGNQPGKRPTAQTPGGSSTPAGAGGTTAACRLPEGALPRARAWRLSPAQYANTLSSLFGVTVPAGTLPADGATRAGFTDFDTQFEAAVVPEQLASIYREQAVRASEQLAPEALKGHACLAEKPAAAACVDAFIRTWAGRAFRRPVAADEATRLGTLLRKGLDSWGAEVGVKLTLQAILQSTGFLYRTEVGAAGKTGRVALTAHELASALSYGLTDSPPDAELLAAADTGKLDRATLRRHAERLARTPEARRKAQDFFSQLLHLDRFASATKDAKLFPQFTPALRSAMLEETTTFLDQELWSAEGSWRGLFQTRHSYVNATLGAHYGVPTQGLEAEAKRTALPEQRRGLLGQGAVLAGLSDDTHTSPTHRGLFILEKLLCRTVPDPPAGAADQADGKITGPDPMATQREHFEFSRMKAPECAGCHGLFMPLGLGLERFDPIGRYRETEHGRRIDPSVLVEDMGDLTGRHEDALALAERISASPLGGSCLVMQFAAYALGRPVDPEGERCEVDAMVARLGPTGVRLPDLMVELTQHESFSERRAGN